MTWTAITNFGLSTPFVLIWGWVKYLRIPVRSDWRSQASLVGLSSPLISGLIWIVALILARTKELHNSTPTMDHLIRAGILIPTVGMVCGVHRVDLILIPQITIASAGAVLFWFATTLP
jgi:hypothetical protein